MTGSSEKVTTVGLNLEKRDINDRKVNDFVVKEKKNPEPELDELEKGNIEHPDKHLKDLKNNDIQPVKRFIDPRVIEEREKYEKIKNNGKYKTIS